MYVLTNTCSSRALAETKTGLMWMCEQMPIPPYPMIFAKYSGIKFHPPCAQTAGNSLLKYG